MFRVISSRMDWFDLLAVQGTLKSLLQHHSSKASILQCSAFFMVQLSHPCMTTGETIALTRQTFIGKVMSLLFNIPSRFVIAFLPRSKCLLILWLHSPLAVILEPKKLKSVTASAFSASIRVCVCASPNHWAVHLKLRQQYKPTVQMIQRRNRKNPNSSFWDCQTQET